MTYAPGIQEFVDRFNEAMPSDFYTRPLAEARAFYENLGVVFPYDIPLGLTITDETVSSRDRELPIRVYRPSQVTGRGLLIYCRGGGFVIGSLESLHSVVAELAANTGLVTIALDFRMAPEHPFPAGLEDCYDALCAIAADPDRFDVDADRIVVAGDSSGANMAVVLAMMTRDRGGPRLRGQALLSPVLDFHRWRGGGEDAPLLTGGEMEFFTACYCPDPAQTLDPYVSPLIGGEFHDLPPAYIMGSELDSLLVDARLCAERLRDNGISAQLVEEQGLVHSSLRARALSPRAAEMWTAFCAATARLAGDR
ncbi:lipase [Longispora fulva]|uniref:Acetyl esterase n=1 Tax=Longispora fulva TaxID=619741 RepID=A0A8J7KP74_9ACTN|nr:alpha/beta hydrolase [Longispora fulva]MBG6135987.1 acetyl esterase [Longispora fulva]GIG55771.1 lipase [Longispora fulva]